MFSVLLLANIFGCQALAKENKQEQSSQINQNLLIPNEAVNSMTDIGKARSVYNLRNMQPLLACKLLSNQFLICNILLSHVCFFKTNRSKRLKFSKLYIKGNTDTSLP